MSEFKVLCNISVKHLPGIKKLLSEIGRVDYRSYNYQNLKKAIARYNVLIPSLNVMLDQDLLCKGTRLKLIATPSTGIDHINLAAAEKMGIKVISLKGDVRFLKTVTATAEHTFGLLLALIRRTPFAFASVQKGHWNSAGFRGVELRGKKLGIIGYGRLGKMVARYGRAFEMTVAAYDPYRKTGRGPVKQVGLETLLRNSDIISLHVPLNRETRKLIAAREFSLMKRGSFLLNTSRGAVIDEAALLAQLENGRLAGAALDVLAEELLGKIKENPLVKYSRTHQNLLITPHLGGVTGESQAKAFRHIIRKIRDYLPA